MRLCHLCQIVVLASSTDESICAFQIEIGERSDGSVKDCFANARFAGGRVGDLESVNTAYTNFLDGLKLANDIIVAKSVRNALVVVGNNWAGHMDYHQPVSIAAGDGAGAAVLGPTSDQSLFRLIDWNNVTNSSYYGAFQLRQRVIEEPGKNYTSTRWRSWPTWCLPHRQ